MIVISLDEGGKFEQLSDRKCNLIGGLAFQCKNTMDRDKESKSLESFFRTICEEQNCTYPFDLHYNWVGDRVVNTENATKVKNALAAEMPDYLRKQGRWSGGRPSDSQYMVFCMVGDKNGLDDQTKSNMRDDRATIRYDRMIYRTLENLIVYNPRFQEERKYNLHLPTRVYRPTTAQEARELRNLGYGRRQKSEGSFDNEKYIVTDETGFRIAVEAVLKNSDRTDLQIDMLVQSINYDAHQPQQQYLYLADTLCSIYQEAIDGHGTNAKALPALMECGNKLVGSDQTLLWAYHPVDIQWRQIWDNFRHGNWFDALKGASEIRASKGAIEKIYQKIWINDFENAALNTEVPRKIRPMEDALARLDDYMQDFEKREQTTGLYIIEQLKRSHEQIGNPDIRGSMEYKFTKILTGLYNHRGDYVHAKEQYEKCMKAVRYESIEEYLGYQLYYIVCLNDSGQYEEAEELAKRVLSQHEFLDEIKKEIDPDNCLIPVSHARAHSQHAQCLTFLGRFDEAIPEFREALKSFADRPKDRSMTGSFLLHALIEKGDKQEYLKAAEEYFGAATPEEQYSLITNGKCGQIAFALYVFLKGLWVFGEKETDPQFIQKIIGETEERMKKEPSEHPWGQVMKYCAFLWHRYFEPGEKHSRSRELMELSKTVPKDPEGLLKAIREENDLQYQNVLNGIDYTQGSKLTFTYR